MTQTVTVYARERLASGQRDPNGLWLCVSCISLVPSGLTVVEIRKRYGIGKHLRVTVRESFTDTETVIQEGA